mmetsp:Transcript_19337/g.57461  ORF Transcript_19337/g.57461 Transcript_19337/m.57461 type:complete len:135 (+) Transcript_19337:241-645(+)|eukprot:CAMPEP_0119271266 /NCGR_PEP_ID=MMETSP1329-20130426/7928_1 /TAXON_ID=114041 /ORGANISM="Genus nov. species nov., Strain RCC1024" /LENGTH=134 /DNA_ID=CAMNT_0007271311 /DNA_START=220 /DNA_END=624 /DNA_ORIENTATION=-
MGRLATAACVLASLAPSALAAKSWVRAWPSSVEQETEITKALDCRGINAAHLVARPERRRATCFDNAYLQYGDGVLCIGDASHPVLDRVPSCVEHYRWGSWYLAGTSEEQPEGREPIIHHHPMDGDSLIGITEF